MSTPIINAQMDAINGTMATLKGDLTTLRPLIKTLKETALNAYPTESLSNQAIASFTDGAKNIPVKSLSVGIEPVQNLNGQSSPYPAGGGKNKLAPAPAGTKNGKGTAKVVSDGNGIYTISGTSTGSSTNIDFTPSVDYTVQSGDYMYCFNTATSSNVVCALYFTDSTHIDFVLETLNKKGALSSAVGKTIATIRIYMGSNATFSGTISPMIANSSAETTFAPYSNICPISGWDSLTVEQAGKNLYPYGTIPVYTYGWYSNYTFDGTPNKVFIKANTDYILSFDHTGNQYVNIRVFDTSKNLITDTAVFSSYQGAYPIPYNGSTHSFRLSGLVPINSVSFCSTVDAYVNFVMGQDQDASTNAQLELGSTASDYHAYAGQTYPISLGQTVYGGTLNVTTGVLTVTMAEVDLGSLGWEYRGTGKKYFGAPFTQGKMGLNNNGNPNGLCSIYACVGQTSLSDMPEKSIEYGRSFAANVYIAVIDSDYTDAATFTTAVTGQKLVYELATPITVQLTPTEVTTLLGQNNIWADTGDITEVTIRCDTALYIQKLVG